MTTFGDAVFQNGNRPVLGVGGYPADYPGRVYLVNNITGSSSGDGFTWASAMDEVSTAITAAEAFRATFGSTNQYVRNQIYVQGTGTAYTKITALPLYCDIIGLGADPRGTNAGVPRIGSDTVAESGVEVTATVRGLNVYNMQFQAGLNEVPFQVASMFRSRFENCSYMTNGAATGNPLAAFKSTAAVGSTVWLDCLIGGSSGSRDTEADIGMDINGTHFHNSLVQNCFIAGKDFGVSVASTVTSGYGSLFKDNFIGESSQVCAVGVGDASTTGDIIYANNFMFSTDDFDLATNGAGRIIGNLAANAYVT